MKNLVIIGMPGSAKSTVGKIAAKKLNRAFFDGDEIYVSMFRESISDTFAHRGEEVFRAREREVYATLGALDGAVISCGGGVVLSPENMAALKANGLVALLTATPEAIYERVSRNRNRPLLADGGIEKVRALLAEREPLYEKYSDFRVDNTYMGPVKCAEKVVSLFTRLTLKQ